MRVLSSRWNQGVRKILGLIRSVLFVRLRTSTVLLFDSDRSSVEDGKMELMEQIRGVVLLDRRKVGTTIKAH